MVSARGEVGDVEGAQAAEWLLRRHAEDVIVNQSGIDMLAERARALVLVGLLDAEVAVTVCTAYQRAWSLRTGVNPWRESFGQPSVRTPPPERRIHACRSVVEFADGVLRVRSVTVTPTNARVAGEFEFTAAAGRHQHPYPPQPRIVVGSAAAGSAHFDGGGDGRSWQGAFVADGRFDPTSTEVKVQGHRLDLEPAVVPTRRDVDVVGADVAQRAARYVRHQLHALGADYEQGNAAAALAILLECGALERDDPVLEEVDGAADVDWVPPMRRRRGARFEPRTVVVDLQAAELDGAVVTVSELRLGGEHVDVTLAAQGVAVQEPSGGLDAPRIGVGIVGADGVLRSGRLANYQSDGESVEGTVEVQVALAGGADTLQADTLQLVLCTERTSLSFDIPIAGRGAG